MHSSTFWESVPHRRTLFPITKKNSKMLCKLTIRQLTNEESGLVWSVTDTTQRRGCLSDVSNKHIASSLMTQVHGLADVKFCLHQIFDLQILHLSTHFVVLAVALYQSYCWRWPFEGWNMAEWYTVNNIRVHWSGFVCETCYLFVRLFVFYVLLCVFVSSLVTAHSLSLWHTYGPM